MGAHIEPTTLFASFNPSEGYKSRFFIDFSSSDFSSSDYADESEAILLIGLLTDFRGYLAAGQWLAPDMSSYCFCHADFADDADFFLLIILVPQISQIFSDFLLFSVVSSFSCHFFISQILDLSVWDFADFL